jgi:hypothetical protein
MKKMFMFLIILFSLLAIQSLPAQAQATGPYDVVLAVNQFRIANGLPALQIDGSLMAAAGAHSDYQASIGQVTHVGANGSRPKDRAIAAGFGGGSTVFISENIAGGLDMSINSAIYNYWQDDLHLHTMLNPAALYIGAGMAKSGNYVYYTVDTGYWVGAPGSGTVPAPTGSTPQPPSGDPIDPFIVSTPGENGAIIHIVSFGQSLIGIANTYKDIVAKGLNINEFVAEVLILNNMSLDDYIFPGDQIILRAAFTPTTTPTPTDLPPTGTRTATATPNNDTATSWPTSPPLTWEPSATATPIAITISQDRQSIVIAAVLISLIALLTVIGVGLFRRN